MCLLDILHVIKSAFIIPIIFKFYSFLYNKLFSTESGLLKCDWNIYFYDRMMRFFKILKGLPCIFHKILSKP